MPDLPRFLAHFDQNYKIFATKLRFRIRRVVLERVNHFAKGVKMARLTPLSATKTWKRSVL